MSVPLAFRAYGEGPPVVVLHGLFGSARNWRTIARRLADRRRVYAVDLRNHGASPWAEPMTSPEMVDDLAAFLDRHRIDRPVLIGHSMGGKTAMLFALLHGRMVDAVVVVDIAPVRYSHTHLPAVEAMRRVDLATVASRAEAERRLAQAIPDADLRSFLMQNLVARGGGYAWRVNLDAIGRHMEELLGFPAMGDLRFPGPALFVSGERSEYIDSRHHERVLSFFPRAEFAVIADAGHRVHAEQPDRFVDAVGRFLAAL